MLKIFKIWYLFTSNSFQQVLANKPLAGLFLLSKFLRIVLFIVFLNYLFQGINGLAGYSREQIVFFYLSYNLIDTLSQVFFREVYRFRSLIITGGLDLILTKPIHPLLRVLLGGADLLDVVMLVFIFAVCLWYGLANLSLSPVNWFVYFLLVINGLVLSMAFHILVLAVGVITTSVDHLILIYRDLSSMLRIPVNIYAQPVRSLLTFVIPLGIMISFPPQALMGLLSPNMFLLAFLFSIISIFLSLKFWNFSLRSYQSAGG